MRCFRLPFLCACLFAVSGAQPKSEKQEPARPLLVLDAGGHTAVVRRVFLTPDGEQAITVSMDKSVRVWDVATGETVRVFRFPSGSGDEGFLNAAALAPDGKRLAAAGLPFGLGKFGVMIYILSLESGQVEQVLRGHRNLITSLAFSPDGKWLASGSTDQTARLYDLATGKVHKVLEGHKSRVSGVSFSPNGQQLATSSLDNTGRIWSVKTGAMSAELKGHPTSVNCIAWSPDGKTLATGSVDGSIRLWESKGEFRKSYSVIDQVAVQMVSLTFSRDSRELLYTGIALSGKTAIIDVASGQRRVDFSAHSNTVVHGFLSADGKRAASTGGNDHETYVWNTGTGEVMQKLMGKSRSVFGIAWGPDGKSIAWGNTNRGATHLANSPLEQSFQLSDFAFGPAPDDTFLRARVERGAHSLNLVGKDFQMVIKEKDRVMHMFKSKLDNERVYCFTMLGEDRAVVGTQGQLYLLDVRVNKILRTFTGHTGIILGVAPAPDDRYFVTGSIDQTIRIWDPNKEEPLLSLFFVGRDWIAWTPEGIYAASANGERLMGWQIHNGPEALASYHPAGQFRKSLYHPEVVKLVLPAGSVEKAVALASKVKKIDIPFLSVVQVLPPEVAITAPANRQRVEGGKVEVKATAKSVGKHPVTALRLLVDGRPYRGEQGIHSVANPKLGEVREAWTVELTPGWHSLMVQAQSAVSKSLSEAVEVKTPDPTQKQLPALYVLAMGVSEYPGRLRLHYAAADAEALAKAFKGKSEDAFSKIEVKVLVDKHATRREILQGLSWLEKSMTPKDVGVVSFSGHGDRDEQGNFYLLPVDANLDNIPGSCVSGDFLKRSLAKIPGRLIALLDACHSGTVAESFARRGPLADDLVRDLVTDDYGVIVMCSSLGKEYSLESSEVKHGFFTLAFMEGLSGKADFNKDKLVHLLELDSYALRRVRELSRGMQHPITGKPPHIRSFPLAKN